MKILSCVPKQICDDVDAKLVWMENVCKRCYKEGIDLFVTPQEFFGGDYMMQSKSAFKEEELLPLFCKWSTEYNVAIVTSLIEEENNKRYERLWFIDKKLKGKLTKLFEPAYTVIGAGSYGLYPETEFFNRFQTFELKGARVTGFFCWEIFSDFLMNGLGVLEPDLVVSAIKFGANAYPKNKKNEEGLKEIESIAYTSGRDIWHERLVMASEFELKAPIICSTNSWNLRARSKPMCGIIYPYLKMNIKKITDEDLKNDVFSVDEVNIEAVRGLREHKFSYKKRTGEFPPWQMAVYTMMMKVHRWEQKLFALMDVPKETKLQKLFREQKKLKSQSNQLFLFNGDDHGN